MPMKIKKMKAIDLSCVSQSSTAICSSIDKCSMIKNSTKSLKTLNSYLGDHYKTLTNNIRSSSNTYSSSPWNCLSKLPSNPRPCSFSSVNHADVVPRRRSSADVMDIKRYMDKHKSSNDHSTKTRNDILLGTPVFGSQGRRSTSGIETRCRFGLVRDGEEEKIRKHFSLIDVGDEKKNKQRNNAYCNGNGVSQKHSGNHSFPQKHPPHQMQRHTGGCVEGVTLSLHCKGCEGKLRKHLSKIEGVTSFSIDMETKKVTVMGNVTPLLLLTSISKVKNAQFWPSQNTDSSSSSSSPSSAVDFFS